MKITFQDLAVFAIGIVASASLFSIGYGLGLANLIGYEYLPWVLPTGVYDAATTALRPSWYYTLLLIGTQTLISIGNSRLFANHPQRFFAIMLLLLITATTIILIKFPEYNALEFALYAAIALFFAALITDEFQRGNVLILLPALFVAFLSLGIIEGDRQIKKTLTSPQTVYIAAIDRNYVNARILHSTVSGVLLKSGKEVIFYPMDKIIRITRDNIPFTADL